MDKKDAVREWANGFDAVEYSLIESVLKNNIDSFYELTRSVIVEGDYVWSNELQRKVEVMEVSGDKAIVEGEVEVDIDDLYDEPDSFLPMWGTLWTFGSGFDEEWARENIDIMKQCGFRVYEFIETGTLYFGIDGADYDFYSHHWTPLYEARGLQWHDKEEE